MKVRLDRLGDEPFVWQETLELSRQDLEHPDVLALSEVDCRGRIARTTTGYLLELELSYEQTLACTRCLGEIVSPLHNRIDLFVEVEDEGKRATELDEEQELEEKDLGVLTLPSPHLDTRPLVKEQVQLHVPMKVLCKDGCAGLCPKCGADLNAGKCECGPTTDPRWAALAKLKDTRGAS